MRIYFFYNESLSGRGGMEQVTITLMNELQQRGHQVLFILSEQSDDPDWEDKIPSILLEKPNYKFYGKRRTHYLTLSKLLEELDTPDVIIALNTFSTYIAKRAVETIGSGAKVISWVHFSVDHLRGRKFLKYADGHLAISSGIFEDLKAITPKIPCKLVFNPIELTKKLYERDTEINFLYVGRLYNKTKRLDFIFKALSQVKGDWKLNIIGDGEDSSKLMNLSRKLRINDKIEWNGWKDTPWDHVGNSSALILASTVEGFPLVTVEAISRGIPVVSSNCKTGPSDIINSNNGWLFETKHIHELTRILQGIVDGSLKLPSTIQCTESVKQFGREPITVKYEEALMEFV